MNESELIDDLVPIEPKKANQSVRIFASLFCGLLLILSAFCYKDIIWFLNQYAEWRGKILLGAESLHGMVSMFCIGSIPVIAYNSRSKRAAAYTITTYLFPFMLAVVLFVAFLLLGMELLFALAPGFGNSLMPQVMVIPPFSAFFDLLFIAVAILNLLTLKLVFRKRKSYLHKQ
ncbi:hypothetical protein D3C87_96340 [compost metagenome]